MKSLGRILAMGVLALFVAGIAYTANQTGPENATVLTSETDDPVVTEYVAPQATEKGLRVNYDCKLKVYMVEKESRWKDSQQQRYENACMSFAFDTVLSLAYQETYQETKVYDLGVTGWVINNADSIFVREDNMMAVAVVFNEEVSGTGISDPYYDDPSGKPFAIHNVDAAAKAGHGETGTDTAYGLYTHTVFIEEMTSHT